MVGTRLSTLALLASFSLAHSVGAQEPPPKPADPSVTTTMEAAEADGDLPKDSIVKGFNDYDWGRFSLRWGGGFLYDYSAYSQTEDSAEQLTLRPKADLRDFRVLIKGKLFLPRLTYTVGYMYDKAKDDWRFRQSGIMIAVPEAYGSFFIGRTKEGFSTSKMMVGYQGWTNERAATNDALLPILADGIKWSGYTPKGHFVYRLGFFKDTRTQYESFNKNDNQSVARLVWLPYAGEEKEKRERDDAKPAPRRAPTKGDAAKPKIID